MLRLLPRKVSFNVTYILIECLEGIERLPALFPVMYRRCSLWSNCNNAMLETEPALWIHRSVINEMVWPVEQRSFENNFTNDLPAHYLRLVSYSLAHRDRFAHITDAVHRKICLKFYYRNLHVIFWSCNRCSLHTHTHTHTHIYIYIYIYIYIHTQFSTIFNCHYLPNRSTLDIGVLGYIGIV